VYYTYHITVQIGNYPSSRRTTRYNDLLTSPYSLSFRHAFIHNIYIQSVDTYSSVSHTYYNIHVQSVDKYSFVSHTYYNICIPSGDTYSFVSHIYYNICIPSGDTYRSDSAHVCHKDVVGGVRGCVALPSACFVSL
jgi:hypothetical protein